MWRTEFNIAHFGRSGGAPGSSIIESGAKMPALLIAVRWIARLSGLVIAVIYALTISMMLQGSFHHLRHLHHLHRLQFPTLTPVQWWGVGLLAATCVGLLVAWCWELFGAVLTLASVVALTVLMEMKQLVGVHVFLPAIPGMLFLISGILRRRYPESKREIRYC